MNDKEFLINMLRLLSALESWSFKVEGISRLPDYLQEDIDSATERLKKELLK